MGMSSHTNSQFRLRERAVVLFRELREYAIHPPRRGSEGERVSGTNDPRRLPASETLLQITIELNRLADAIASGRGDEFIHDGTVIPDGVNVLMLIPALRARAVTLKYDRIPADALRHARRIAALSDREDDSDALVSSWLTHFELRLADWVRGHDPEDVSSVESGSEW